MTPPTVLEAPASCVAVLERMRRGVTLSLLGMLSCLPIVLLSFLLYILRNLLRVISNVLWACRPNTMRSSGTRGCGSTLERFGVTLEFVGMKNVLVME